VNTTNACIAFPHLEFFCKRKNGTAPTPLTNEKFKMAIERGLSPAICVEMFGMENTIDDTTESSLLPFLEVLELKTQNKSATVKKFTTTKQDRKCPAVFKKPPTPREIKKCEGHKDACGKLGHTWYECFNNPKNLHKRPEYWNKKPSKTNKTPKEKSNMVFSSEQVTHMFNMMHNNLKEPPK
jgi:hypothetical protein